MQLKVFAIAVLAILPALAQADTQVFYPGPVLDYRWTLPSGRGWLPGIGDYSIFGIKSVEVTTGGGNVEFNILHNFPPEGHVPATLGILALGFGSWDYKLAVDLASGNVYRDPVLRNTTAAQPWIGGGYYYAGACDPSDPRPIPTSIISGNLVGHTDILWTPGSDTKYSVSFTLAQYLFGTASQIDFNLGMASCANWDVFGEANLTQVPIPASVFLLGTGLLGLFLLRKKKNSDK